MQSQTELKDRITVRFAGDSGDGMQLTGDRLAKVSALFGNGVATLADFPAEIRAPQGTTFGVSGYQLQIGGPGVLTPGEKVDLLVAMNPAALKVNLRYVKPGGMLLINKDAFIEKNIERAGYQTDPLEDGSLDGYRVSALPISHQTLEALKESPLSPKEKGRCKNFFALGLVSWLLDRPLEPTGDWISKKFEKVPEVAEANRLALREGVRLAETCELFNGAIPIAPRKEAVLPGHYRFIGGNQALALGLVTASQALGRGMVYGSYPITPASDLLHELSRLVDFDVKTFQAEDEISAVGAALGAAYAGSLGVTATSGPGLVLKQEFIGLGVMVELPLVVLDIQRAGPSTGMPTKTEQTDLNLALNGRNGESPCVVLAPQSPADCFEIAYEACRLAVRYMTPVIVLSDGYLANGLEAWRIPDPKDLPPVLAKSEPLQGPEDFLPYARDDKTLARPWIAPGHAGYEHRVGGLEKEQETGKISYEPENHEAMCRIRQEKINRVAQEYPPSIVHGPEKAGVLLVGWGSSFGALRQACEDLAHEGLDVAHLQLRHIHPLPNDLADIWPLYSRILVAENNLGQLRAKLQASYPATTFGGINEVTGQPLHVTHITEQVRGHWQGGLH